MFLGDAHNPHIDWDVIEWCYYLANKFKVHRVIQGGDLNDMSNWKNFPREADLGSAEQEWEAAYTGLDRLHSYFPKMDIIYGNHDSRLFKKLEEVGLPHKEQKKVIDSLYARKGWTFHNDDVPLIVNNDIMVIHGHEMGGTLVDKVRVSGMNVVTFHTHKSELVFIRQCNIVRWGALGGCVIDLKSPAIRYARKNIPQYMNSVTLVIDNNPIILKYPGKGNW